MLVWVMAPQKVGISVGFCMCVLFCESVEASGVGGWIG